MKKIATNLLSLMSVLSFAVLIFIPQNVKAADVSVNGTTLTVTGSGELSKDQINGVDKNSITEIIIGEGITEIGASVFEGFDKVTSLSLPSTLNKMGFYAFKDCTALKSVTIPKSVTETGGYVFKNSGVETATFEEGSTVVAASIFQEAKNLTTINFASSITKIGDCAFENCTSLVTVTLPGNVKTLGFYAFKDCTGIKAITIPKTVTETGGYVFKNSGVETATFEEGSTVAAASIFQEAKNLTTVYWPNSIKKIGSSAFEGCTALKSIVLPWYVEVIDFYAFKDCESLSDITIYQKVKDINEYAFKNIPSKAVIRGKKGTVAQSFAKKQKYSFKKLTKIPALKGESYVVGNVIYKVTDDTIDGKGTVMVTGLKKNVSSISIADKVKLESYKYKVTKIDAKAFYKKSSLKKINISATDIKTMGKNAFAGINKKAVITVPSKKFAEYKTMLKSAGIPKSVAIKKK